MASTNNRPLAIALFRGILRWTRSARGVPCNLRPSDVHEVVPELAGSYDAFLQDCEAVHELTRKAFRKDRSLKVISLLTTPNILLMMGPASRNIKDVYGLGDISLTFHTSTYMALFF